MLFRKLQRTDVWITKQLTLSLGLNGLCQPVYLWRFTLCCIQPLRVVIWQISHPEVDVLSVWQMTSMNVKELFYQSLRVNVYCRQMLYSLITVNRDVWKRFINCHITSILFDPAFFAFFFLFTANHANVLVFLMWFPCLTVLVVIGFFYYIFSLVNSPQQTPNLPLLKLN